VSRVRLAAAALRAVELAEFAAARGTFGVGGVLLGPRFEVLHEAENHVVESGRTFDPTAHVERQLVDWYFDVVRGGKTLPPPHLCTIVSSLDPCMQCAGAILATGFRCLAIAEDAMAGVHYAGWGSASSLPAELRDQAAQAFGCFAVAGQRGYSGPADATLAAAEIEPRLLVRARDALLSTLAAVQAAVAAAEPSSRQIIGSAAPMATRSANFTMEQVPDMAASAIHRRLTELASARDGSGDAACFIDTRSGLGAFARQRADTSPIATAIMELVRGYAKFRWDAVQKQRNVPAHPKHCTLYTLQGPGRGPLSVMALGAIGSTLEGPVPRPGEYWRYFHRRQAQAQLDRILDAFPPLYRDVIGIRPRALALA
jgi:tRNA(Arg) A34 adenosine deaminase TadA